MDFLDELGSGVTPVSAAEIRDEFEASYTGLATLLLVAPLALSLVVETPLLVLSDRWRRERVVPLGLASMGCLMLLASQASSAWLFVLAFAGWGSASGVTCGVAQGSLMHAYPEDRERWMTRWTLMGALGDASAPLLTMGTFALGWGWRGALATIGGMFVAHGVVVLSSGIPSATADPDEEGEDQVEEPEVPLREAFAAALKDRRLLGWLSAGALCVLLDEVLVAFGTLYMRDSLGATPTEIGIAWTIEAVCAAGALLVVDRLLRRVPPIRIVLVASVLCVGALVGWLSLGSFPASVACLCLVAMFAAPAYPIAAARAYAAVPDRPGLVAAVDQLFSPITILAPLAVGLVADQWGLVTALLCLGLQPVGVVVVALAVGRRPRAASDGP